MKTECEILNDTLNSLLLEHADHLRVAVRRQHDLLTALRRIRSLEAKNITKYARQIAGEALDRLEP